MSQIKYLSPIKYLSERSVDNSWASQIKYLSLIKNILPMKYLSERSNDTTLSWANQVFARKGQLTILWLRLIKHLLERSVDNTLGFGNKVG